MSGTWILLAGQALLLATVATSWNMVGGYLGQIDLGHVAYFGLGAYATGLAMAVLGWSLVGGLVAAVVVVAVVAGIVGAVVLRLRGPTFALATLGVLVAVREIVRVAEPVTGGGRGLVLPVLDPVAFLVAAALLFTVALTLSWRLRHTARWPVLLAVRHDETAAAARGIPTLAWKQTVFTLAAAVTGAAGGLWAFQSTYVDPDLAFADSRSLDMITGALLGGLGTVAGPVAGALVLFAGRAVPWLPADPYVVLLQGLVLVGVVRWLPRGLLGGAAGERAVEDLLGGLTYRPSPGLADIPPEHGPDTRLESAAPNDRDGAAARVRFPERERPVLDVGELRLRVGGADVLDGVDLAVRPGEVLAVIGPNGSGKSTLADCLSRLTPADSGEIVLAGRDITRVRAPLAVRIGLARTFNPPRIYHDLTAMENLLLCGRWTVAGSTHEDQEREERAAASLAELAVAPTTPASALTPATQQLLEIAMARMLQPRVLLLDEATAGVPSGPLAAVKSAIRTAADAGTAVIVIEHDIGVLADVCDRVAILNHGRVVAEGTPASIVETEAIETAYFGTMDGG